MIKKFVAVCTLCIVLLTFNLTACSEEKRYTLSVTGSELLYEDLKDKYRAGEEVAVKVRIKPCEGVKVALDTERLVKTKSSQNEYWQFTFEMPAREATLNISSYKGFDEPVLYGLYLTFDDNNGEPIEAFNKPVDSEEAIADYTNVYYEDNHKVIFGNDGANVFADRKSKVGTNSYEQESTLYYTYELLNAVVVVHWVYIDEKTQQIYSYGGDTGYRLDDIGLMSVSNTQNLSDNRFDIQMKEYEEKFDSSVKVNFACFDYLTGVKVLEYNANNELIQSTAIEKSENEIAHIATEDCEYVVIEEEYTVMHGENSGNKYTERSLINKNELGGGKLLKYPRGDGLISPVYLSVEWQNET